MEPKSSSTASPPVHRRPSSVIFLFRTSGKGNLECSRAGLACRIIENPLGNRIFSVFFPFKTESFFLCQNLSPASQASVPHLPFQFFFRRTQLLVNLDSTNAFKSFGFLSELFGFVSLFLDFTCLRRQHWILQLLSTHNCQQSCHSAPPRQLHKCHQCHSRRCHLECSRHPRLHQCPPHLWRFYTFILIL